MFLSVSPHLNASPMMVKILSFLSISVFKNVLWHMVASPNIVGEWMTKGMDENMTSGISNCGDLWKCMETKTMMIWVQSLINATMKISGVVAKECLRLVKSYHVS